MFFSIIACITIIFLVLNVLAITFWADKISDMPAPSEVKKKVCENIFFHREKTLKNCLFLLVPVSALQILTKNLYAFLLFALVIVVMLYELFTFKSLIKYYTNKK